MEFLNKIKKAVDTTAKKVVAALLGASVILGTVATYFTEIVDKLK